MNDATTSSQMIEVSTPDGTADAYLTRPAETTGPLPGVLFFIDALTLRPQIETMADRIASWGYVVMAPNVFYRDGSADELAPAGDLTDPDARDAVIATMMPKVKALFESGGVAGDVRAYVEAMMSTPGVSAGPIGVTGYCMGGRIALLAATEKPDEVAALGMFHTGGLVSDGPDSLHRRAADLKATVLAVHADHDRSLTSEDAATFEQALTDAGVAHDTSIYPDAPHGYTMADTEKYHREASEHHFDELAKLLMRTLH